jgi:hypothetical protein
MAGIPTADEIEAAKAALQANLPPQAKKQEEEGSTAGDVVSGVLDVASNVTIDAVGVAVEVVGTVVEGAGAAVVATGEAVVSVIGGIFEGLG